MMKFVLSLFFMSFLSISVSAVDIAGVTIPDKLSAQSQALSLNGVGVRSKFFMEIYVAGLYLTEASKEANAIIERDQSMALRLHVTSDLLSPKRMEDATREGFEKSTSGHSAPIQANIDLLVSTFKDGIKEGDVFDFVYTPESGVKVYKNNDLKSTIEGLQFKQALWGIWLSSDPVQDDLKTGLLGQL